MGASGRGLRVVAQNPVSLGPAPSEGAGRRAKFLCDSAYSRVNFALDPPPESGVGARSSRACPTAQGLASPHPAQSPPRSRVQGRARAESLVSARPMSHWSPEVP